MKFKCFDDESGQDVAILRYDKLSIIELDCDGVVGDSMLAVLNITTEFTQLVDLVSTDCDDRTSHMNFSIVQGNVKLDVSVWYPWGSGHAGIGTIMLTLTYDDGGGCSITLNPADHKRFAGELTRIIEQIK